MPYTPPNPYGSFFNFADPAVLAQQSFIPNPTGTMSQGTLSAMGMPSGGFNPTLAEFTATRYRDVAYQQFIARSLATDPTTRTFSNMAMEMLAKDKVERAAMVKRFGASNIDQVTGFALNMSPFISGLMGGSARSIPLGALSAATSGLRWNNMGMIGDGQVQLNSAKSITDMIRNNFYTSSGAQRLDMTQGLNKDQLGAILASGGAQGAFAGLDMGKIDRFGKMSFNESSMSRIKDFTKNAAKAISGLIDIYGDANFNELFDKAQRITGLDFSRMGNADLMRSRLASLRDTARIAGVDTQTMFDLSSGLVNYGQAMGFSRSTAGTVADSVAGQAAWQFQMARQTAGSFYSPTRGLGDISSSLAMDKYGMMLDPLGARRNALELMIQDQMIRGDDITRLRALSQVGAGQTPGAVAGKMDTALAGMGINMVNYIRMHGGPREIIDQLSPENQALADQANAPDLQQRLHRILGAQVHLKLKNMGALGQESNLMNIVNNLDPATAIKLMTAAGAGGTESALSEIVKTTLVGQMPGTRASLVQSAFSLGGAFGDGTLGMYNDVLRMTKTNPRLRDRILSREEQVRRDAQSFYDLGTMDPDDYHRLQGSLAGSRGGYYKGDAGDYSRGQFKGTILQGILDRAGGTDMQSMLAITMNTEEGRRNMVGTYKKGSDWFMSTFDFSPDNMGTAAGIADLTRFRDDLMSSGKRAWGEDILRTAGIATSGTISASAAAEFGGRFAVNPLGTFPGLSAIMIGQRSSFLRKAEGKRIRDYTAQLSVLSQLHEYVSDPKNKLLNRAFNKTAKAFGGLSIDVNLDDSDPDYVRSSFDNQLTHLRAALLDPDKDLGKDFDVYSSLGHSGGLLANVAPGEISELAKTDPRFGQYMAELNLDPRIKEAIKQAGLDGAGGYQLKGFIDASDPHNIRLDTASLRPVDK